MLSRRVRRRWLSSFFIFVLSGFVESAAAYSSIGEFSDQVLGPLSTFNHFVFIVSYILGAGFLAASAARYMEFRRNPIQTRLSSVMLILFLGLALVLLPLIASYSPAVSAVKQPQHSVVHRLPAAQPSAQPQSSAPPQPVR